MWAWLSPAIGVVLFLGAAATYLRGAADKGTIESLNRSNAALHEELGLTTLKCDKLEERVGAVELENRALRSAVTHSEEIRHLTVCVEELLRLARGETR